jgi:hypothetical protein
MATDTFNQANTNFNLDTHAFSVGSIVDSGNGGDAGDVTVVAVSAAVALSENDSDQAGLAGGLAIPVALSAQGTALQDNAPLSIIPINVGVGVGDNTTSSTATVGTVQANLSSQRSTTVAASSQDGIGNGIDANGGNGQAFMITIGSNNTSIDNTSVSLIVAASLAACGLRTPSIRSISRTMLSRSPASRSPRTTTTSATALPDLSEPG